MKCPGINIHCAGCKSGGGSIIGIIAIIIVAIIAAKAGSIAHALIGLMEWLALTVAAPMTAILIGLLVYSRTQSLKVITRYELPEPATVTRVSSEQIRQSASYVITSMGDVPAIESRGQQITLNGIPVDEYAKNR